MLSTIVGPYPRRNSPLGERLKKEADDWHLGRKAGDEVSRTYGEMTSEVARELSSYGVDFPNDGRLGEHDEITGGFEFLGETNLSGARYGGIKKIFHNNTEARNLIVEGELRITSPLEDELYKIAKGVNPDTKIELTGPYTLAKHSIIGDNAPYRDFRELTFGFADMYKEALSHLSQKTLVQFNEPSIVAYWRDKSCVEAVPDAYDALLSGADYPAVVWTYYGKPDQKQMDMLLSLPTYSVGFDFIWDNEDKKPVLEGFLREAAPDKPIGLGIVSSVDNGQKIFEKPQELAERILGFADFVDLDLSFISPNATLTHLPRNWARDKMEILRKTMDLVNEKLE